MPGGRGERGESLIVVLLAMAIFTVVLTSLFRLRPAVAAGVNAAERRTQAALAAQSRLEILKARPESLRPGRWKFTPAGIPARSARGLFVVVRSGRTAEVTVTVSWGPGRGEQVTLATLMRVR
jgi:Tfp pilus assembly protein PilV